MSMVKVFLQARVIMSKDGKDTSGKIKDHMEDLKDNEIYTWIFLLCLKCAEIHPTKPYQKADI